MIKDIKPENDNLGMWQAYVEKGRSKEERNLRLSAVPQELKETVRNHVETVFRLKVKK